MLREQLINPTPPHHPHTYPITPSHPHTPPHHPQQEKMVPQAAQVKLGLRDPQVTPELREPPETPEELVLPVNSVSSGGDG